MIELEVPGFEEKELGIEVSEHTLTIEGERKAETEEEPEKAFRFRERLEKTFERRFYLPLEADTVHVEATFAKGVIKVHIPRGPRGEAIGTVSRGMRITRSLISPATDAALTRSEPQSKHRT